MKRTLIIIKLCILSFIIQAQINAVLTPSRTSGKAPLAVYFDTWGTTATGVNQPWHHLDYTWDFDDPNSGNWGPNGKSKNSATGPAAAHVFETAGTYSVKLTVKDGNGNSTIKTVNITVTDFSDANTIYFSTSGDFSGVPAASQKVTTNQMSVVMSYQATGKRLLLKKGETFTTGSTTSDMNVPGPCMLGSYGSGNGMPRVTLTGSTGNDVFAFHGTDWRLVDIEVQGPGHSAGVCDVKKGNGYHNLIMRTKMVPGTFHTGFGISGNAMDGQGSDLPKNAFIIENDWRDVGFGNGGNMMFIAARETAIMGNHFEDAEDGEHIIRVQHGEKMVISNNYLARQRDLKLVLTLRSRDKNGTCTGGCGRPTREIVVSDNVIESAAGIAIQAVGSNKSTESPHGRDVIFERNYITQHGSTSNEGTKGIWIEDNPERITVRNNIVNMTNWKGWNAIHFTLVKTAWAYNNTIYSPDNGSYMRGVRAQSGTNITVRNNILYAPNASSPDVVHGSPTVASNNISPNGNPFISSSFNGPADFALKNSSVAKDAGFAVPVYNDFGLNDRPSGSGWDIGAYEYAGTSSPITVTGVSVSPTSTSVGMGQTVQLNETVLPANATNKNVTWSSSNNGIASVNANGLVTANGVGTATITVTTVDGGHTATSTIIVTNSNVAVTGISVTPSNTTLNVGQTQQLTETVNPSNATDQSVSWSTNNSSVATVNGNGLVTAVGAGTATITVTTTDGGFTATSTITVNSNGGGGNCTSYRYVRFDMVAASSLRIYEMDWMEGGTAYPTQTMTNWNAPSPLVVSQPNNQKKGSVWKPYDNDAGTNYYHGSGPMDLKLDLGVGNEIRPDHLTMNISGSLTQFEVWVSEDNNTWVQLLDTTGNFGSGTYPLHLPSCGGTGNVAVTGVSVTPTSANIKVGETIQLSKTITPANATDQTVTWSSSDNSIATVSFGVVTAVSPGNVVITVTTNDGGYTATSNVTVNPSNVAVTGVSVTPTTATLDVGQTIQLSKTITPANAADKTVTWSSSDNSIATVSFGVVTALAPGNVTITVTTNDGGHTATANVTVNSTNVAVTGVSVTPTTATLDVGQTIQLSKAITPANATDQTVTWSSSDNSIATVSFGVVTALSPGNVVITVTTNDGGHTATANVTVNTCSASISPVDICLVTVDQNSSNNVVVWEKPNDPNISHFVIYREVNGTYVQAGTVAYTSLSEYVDNDSGVDPNITSYSYKISAVDICGNETVQSTAHKTMHLTQNAGINGEINLVWDNYVGIPFNYFVIQRDGGNGLQAIDTISSSNFTYSDINPPVGTIGYAIKIVSPTNCVSTRSNNYSASVSNKVSLGTSTGLNDLDLWGKVKIYPNPTNGLFHLVNEMDQHIWSSISIWGAQGQKVLDVPVIPGKFSQLIDLRDMSSGFYQLQLISDDQVIIKKVLVN